MGVHHENEKALEHGIVVDIFIPPTTTTSSAAAAARGSSGGSKRRTGNKTGMRGSSAIDRNLNSHGSSAIRDDDSTVGDDDKESPKQPGWKGRVIEFDGPTHFETYISAPLGSTAIKWRHLNALGYSVASLPYWKYRLEYSNEEKQSALRRVLSSMEK